MDRIKITIPPAEASFSTEIPIRITDLNYGGHVGNDSFLTLIHEARMRYLAQYGYTELNCGGIGLIMTDAAIEFKKELMYGDTAVIQVSAGNFTRAGFDLFYQIIILANDNKTIAAKAKTGMLCFDYNKRKVATVPAEVSERLK